MNILRAALHPLALGGLMFLADGPVGLFQAGAAVAACALGWASLWVPLRRWALPAAWLASFAAVAAGAYPMELGPLPLVALPVLLAALVVALHQPPDYAPPVGPQAFSFTLLAATVVAAALVWLPALRLAGEPLALQDPSTPAGAALRTAVACLAIAAVLGLLEWAFRRLRTRGDRRQDKAGGPSPD